jgi:tetratricopeptide (TPR) repeat protein
MTRMGRPLFVVLLAALLLTGCIKPTPAQRAISLAHMQRVDEGVTLLRAAIAKDPDDVDARRVLVRLLGLQGDLNAARKEAEALQKRLHEGDPSGWLELGHAYELAHKFDEALAAYDTAASVAPGSPAGPLEGGMRCARWGESEEARARLEEAVKRGANDAEVWHTLGLVRLHQRDFDGATEAYKKGLDVDGSHPENWLGLASVAVMKGDAKGALDAYSALLGLRPNFGAAELGRAWALAKLGRNKEALAALDHAEALGAPRANIAKQRAALAAPRGATPSTTTTVTPTPSPTATPSATTTPNEPTTPAEGPLPPMEGPEAPPASPP